MPKERGGGGGQGYPPSLLNERNNQAHTALRAIAFEGLPKEGEGDGYFYGGPIALKKNNN